MAAGKIMLVDVNVVKIDESQMTQVVVIVGWNDLEAIPEVSYEINDTRFVKQVLENNNEKQTGGVTFFIPGDQHGNLTIKFGDLDARRLII